MDEEMFKFQTWVHDIECPICKQKPYFVVKGKLFDTESCGHKPLHDLLKSRQDDTSAQKKFFIE